MGTREGCVPRLQPSRAGGEDAGTHGPAGALLGRRISRGLLRPSGPPSGPGRGSAASQALWLRPWGPGKLLLVPVRSMALGSGAHTPT